ncbi:MAG: molecular chaperone HtpG, partial [Geminicoccaceae bacterium]
DEQYKEFYHHVAHAFDEPFARVHFTAEGTLSYTALLFVPSQKPFDLYDPKRRHGVKLYVRRVFITDELDSLMPRYLRFVSGIVDSEDLQLNVSRETLQHGAVVARMRKAIVRRVLDELVAKAKPAAEGEEAPKGESYESWWGEFGAVLKEGLYEDADNRPKLLELARFRSTHGPGWASLADYVARMKEGQGAILYISGESHTALRTSPQLEEAVAKGVEVLLLDDPVDEFWLQEVTSFQNHDFRSLTRGDIDLSGIQGEAEARAAEPLDDTDLKRLIARLKAALGDEVGDVRASKRLRDSAVCLVADDQGMDLRMERFLKQHSQLDKLSKRVLEINGQHELTRRMAAMAVDEAGGLQFDELAKLLLDQARIVEGEPIPDPGAFSRRMSSFLAKGLAA